VVAVAGVSIETRTPGTPSAVNVVVTDLTCGGAASAGPAAIAITPHAAAARRAA